MSHSKIKDHRTSSPRQKRVSPPTQMLERHLDRFIGQDALVVGCPADDSFSILAECLASQTTTFLTFDYAAYLIGGCSLGMAKNSRHSIVFSSWYNARPAKHDLVVLYLQKG